MASRIAVVIPTYNVEQQIEGVLRRCLLDQNVTIFVSDGGSRDKTIQVASKVAIEAPGRIHVQIASQLEILKS